MVLSSEKTVAAYLDSLEPDRRTAVDAVRKVIKKNLPRGVVEVMSGMIGYVVPLSKYPNTYNGEPLCVAGIAAQKNYNSVYLMGIYGDPAAEKWFRAAWAKSGKKKLDMGKCCVRFKKLDDISLEVIGEAVARTDVDKLIAVTEALHPAKKKR